MICKLICSTQHCLNIERIGVGLNYLHYCTIVLSTAKIKNSINSGNKSKLYEIIRDENPDHCCKIFVNPKT